MSHLLRGEEKGLGKDVVDKHVAGEIETMRDILELEPDSKWPTITLVRLLELQAGRLDSSLQEEKQRLQETVAEMYHKLSELDHMRRGYYKDAATGVGKLGSSCK